MSTPWTDVGGKSTGSMYTNKNIVGAKPAMPAFSQAPQGKGIFSSTPSVVGTEGAGTPRTWAGWAGRNLTPHMSEVSTGAGLLPRAGAAINDINHVATGVRELSGYQQIGSQLGQGAMWLGRKGLQAGNNLVPAVGSYMNKGLQAGQKLAPAVGGYMNKGLQLARNALPNTAFVNKTLGYGSKALGYGGQALNYGGKALNYGGQALGATGRLLGAGARKVVSLPVQGAYALADAAVFTPVQYMTGNLNFDERNQQQMANNNTWMGMAGNVGQNIERPGITITQLARNLPEATYGNWQASSRGADLDAQIKARQARLSAQGYR